MATTGFIFSDSGSAKPEHTNTNQAFFTNGFWFCLVLDTNDDYHLYQKDLSTPSTPGDTGGWTKLTAVEPESRGTGRCWIAWDESAQVLHCFSSHGTTPRYNKYTYTAGTPGSWAHNVTNETVPVTAVAVEAHQAITVDSNGIVIVIDYEASANPQFHYRDTDNTWKTGTDLETGGTASANDLSCIAFPCVVGGNASIGVFYGYAGSGASDGWRFAHMADSATKSSASWTTELAIAQATVGIDDHVHAIAYVKSGDTNSTIVVALKEGGADDIFAVVRDDGGTWGTAVLARADSTRPKVIVDATNNKFRITFQRAVGTSINKTYFESDVATSISFGSEIVWLEDDGIGEDFDTEEASPDHACDSNSGWFWAASDWWNLETIAGGGSPIANTYRRRRIGFSYG